MSFVSVQFLVFLALFLAAWPVVRAWAIVRLAVIVGASLLFYGLWDWRFVPLLVATGLVDYMAAAEMVRRPKLRPWLLWASMGVNIGTLVVFKYLNWGVSQVAPIIGVDPSEWWFGHTIILPVGISFYTFQSMSYTIDVYRREIQPATSLLHYFASLFMFAHLVAGPVIRASYLLPQLLTPGDYGRDSRWQGLKLIVAGYFKKMVVANNIAPVVDQAFAATGQGGGFWWVAASLFALQIYADFSGYTDIARGIARWMGYSFPLNFDHPYASFGFRDFWSRWHISLSTWFRDYVYVPLGGNRRSLGRGVVNLWITMLVSALWHGANWTFVLWGALHAVYLTVERLIPWPRRFRDHGLARLASWTITLLCGLFAWVFFRAATTGVAFKAARAMLLQPAVGAGNAFELITPYAWLGAAVLIAGELAVVVRRFWPPQHDDWRLSPSLEPAAIVMGLLACVFLRGPAGAFIYFQF